MKWSKEFVDNNKGYYPILGICRGIQIFACYAYDDGMVWYKKSYQAKILNFGASDQIRLIFT